MRDMISGIEKLQQGLLLYQVVDGCNRAVCLSSCNATHEKQSHRPHTTYQATWSWISVHHPWLIWLCKIEITRAMKQRNG